MKKFLLFLIVSSIFLIPFTVSKAQLGNSIENLDSAVGGDTGLQRDLATNVGTVVKGVLSLVGTIFLLLTVYAGILWMTAQGDETKVSKSIQIIKASIIGLIITLSAYAITYFVTNRLGGGSGTGKTGANDVGCCINSKDISICAAIKRNECDLNKAVWNPGACPNTCKVK